MAHSGSHAKVPLISLPDGVARRIGDDELRARVATEHDGVLTKGPAENHGFIAIDPVNDPRGFAPDAFRLLFVPHAVLDAVTAENQEIAQDGVARFVDSPRKEHGSRIVRGQNCESLPEERRKRFEISNDLAVERHAKRAIFGRKLVKGRQVGAK